MITYSVEGVKMPKIKKRETSAWIRKVAASHGRKVGEVGYMFVDDEKILEVNNEYLGHDYYTDVITFDYDEGDVINGDIVISLDTVRTNAKKKDYSSLKYWKSHIFRRDYLIQQEGQYKGAPLRTTAGGRWLNGYSDHLPVVMYLVKEKK